MVYLGNFNLFFFCFLKKIYKFIFLIQKRHFFTLLKTQKIVEKNCVVQKMTKEK